MDTIGNRIKLLRKELHLTQEEFGEVIGISGGGVSKYEADATKPPEAAIKLICATYKVNYEWLVDGLGDMWQGRSLEDLVEQYMAGESPLAISIMKAFVRLPDEEWTRLRDMIDTIKREGLP